MSEARGKYVQDRPDRSLLEEQLSSFLRLWSDVGTPLEELLELLHPLAFDLQLPQGRARGRDDLAQLRGKVTASSIQPRYRPQRIGPVRDTNPPGGFRIAVQVASTHGTRTQSRGPISVIFEFRRVFSGGLRIARIQPST